MFCPNCGAENPAIAVFCENCGNKIIDKPENSSSKIPNTTVVKTPEPPKENLKKTIVERDQVHLADKKVHPH